MSTGSHVRETMARPVQAARLWSPNTQEAITIALGAHRAGLLLDLLRGAERR